MWRRPRAQAGRQRERAIVRAYATSAARLPRCPDSRRHAAGPHASASHCFRDRPAQDRGDADRDVGDHRRRREPAAPEVGQRRQRAPSRFAAVAASARCRGSPPNGQLPTTSEARAGQGLLAPPEDRRLNVGSYARRCCVAMSSRRQHTRWSRRTASLSVLTRMARL